MSWDYFALFAIVALLFWGWGAFAAWRGKRPAVVYTLISATLLSSHDTTVFLRFS